jgi:hypothetical protein
MKPGITTAKTVKECKAILCVAVVLLTASVSLGQGKQGTGNALIVQCVEQPAAGMPISKALIVAQDMGYCFGLVTGVGDMLQGDHLVSFPDDSNIGQMVRVVVKYLTEHPAELADKDSILVMRALMSAFPEKITNNTK